MSNLSDTKPGQELPEKPRTKRAKKTNAKPELPELPAETIAELVAGLGKVIRETGLYTPLGISLRENHAAVIVLARASDDPAVVEAFRQTFADTNQTVQTFLIDAGEGEASDGNGEAKT